VWKFFPGMRRLSVGVNDHWTALLERWNLIKRMVEGLLEKAREDVPELRGKDEVEVRVVSAEEMRFGREDEVGTKKEGGNEQEGNR